MHRLHLTAYIFPQLMAILMVTEFKNAVLFDFFLMLLIQERQPKNDEKMNASFKKVNTW